MRDSYGVGEGLWLVITPPTHTHKPVHPRVSLWHLHAQPYVMVTPVESPQRGGGPEPRSPGPLLAPLASWPLVP